MKSSNLLTKPPKNPLIYANIIAERLPSGVWTEAFSRLKDKKHRSDQHDNEFLYKAIVPLGHAIPPRYGAIHGRDPDWYWQFSEEFRDLLLDKPDFFSAWSKLLDL